METLSDVLGRQPDVETLSDVSGRQPVVELLSTRVLSVLSIKSIILLGLINISSGEEKRMQLLPLI